MRNDGLTSTSAAKVKVLFIAGPTRSGSTIISNILGQINGFFHAGEVIEAWDRGRIWKCSCGRLPVECAVWSKIFSTLDAAVSPQDQADIIRIRDELSRSHKVILNHYRRTGGLAGPKSASLYDKGLSTLYAIIANATNAEVIVDSSKNVGYADSLTRIGNIDLHVIHLVRDSRATAYSWSKKKQELWQTNPYKTSMEWSSRNIALECLKKRHPDKYIKVRYEDFMTTPRKTILQILHHLQITKATLPFVSPNEVIIESSHGLCGNPGRYSHGVEQLVLDNRWKHMNKRDGLVATALTWPLLLKYHYQLHLS